jgi:hypothetical protein
MELFVLSLSDFFNLIVVNVELLIVEGSVVEGCLSFRSLLGVFITHKGIDCLSILGEEFNVFDLSEL